MQPAESTPMNGRPPSRAEETTVRAELEPLRAISHARIDSWGHAAAIAAILARAGAAHSRG